jgi:DNA-binding Xre family transcriptional regulator
MRTPNITLIHETVSFCFDQVLTTLGDRTKRVVYDFLARRGISKEDLSRRFGDVEGVMMELYGQGGRSVMIGTLAKICDEYSIPLNLSYSDSLGNRMSQLTENILMQKLIPRHFRKDVDTRTFEDKTGSSAGWSD